MSYLGVHYAVIPIILQEGMVPRAGLLIGQMVSVYVNENQGPSGWHRGKLLEMDASNNQ